MPASDILRTAIKYSAAPENHMTDRGGGMTMRHLIFRCRSGVSGYVKRTNLQRSALGFGCRLMRFYAHLRSAANRMTLAKGTNRV